MRLGLRKRLDVEKDGMGCEELVERMGSSCGVVIFSGSGISVSSGMSSFTSPGGLYERAKRRFKLRDGMALFGDRFFRSRRRDALGFLAEVYGEALVAKPSESHRALLQLEGRIRRHVTLNVDGILLEAGADIWHPKLNPNGTYKENVHAHTHTYASLLFATTKSPFLRCTRRTETDVNGGAGDLLSCFFQDERSSSMEIFVRRYVLCVLL